VGDLKSGSYVTSEASEGRGILRKKSVENRGVLIRGPIWWTGKKKTTER